jgi:hypothetical protein
MLKETLAAHFKALFQQGSTDADETAKNFCRDGRTLSRDLNPAFL